MRLVYFGSGAFGLPTFRTLVNEHEVALVVSQPDRPAGRRQSLTPTPIAEYAQSRGIPIIKPHNPNGPSIISQIHAVRAEAYVVIAYGHKLGMELLGNRFAINLHASLLPKFRGAAPIKWAMINEEPQTGISVISLAQRMDAGAVYAQRKTAIHPTEIADELEQRLAELGPEAVKQVLQEYESGSLHPDSQAEAATSPAPKLTKADGTVSFDQPASSVRARINALNSWPGCTVTINGQPLKILRADLGDAAIETSPPGTILESRDVVCGVGSVRFLQVQPPGKRAMTLDDYRRGRSLEPGARCETL